MDDFSRLSRAALEAMARSGRTAAQCQAALAQAGSSILGEALRGAGKLEPWQHAPEGDVYDPATHAQYFYHLHPPDERPAGEHGHFHIFLRARGMPPGLLPMVMPELAIADNPAAPPGPLVPSAPRPLSGEEDDPWCHLAAIALSESGEPIRLFTCNRWVTGETWYRAADVAAMLDHFALGEAGPSPLLNRWIGAMVGLYKPQLASLLQARDAAVMSWRRRRRGKVHVLEDRRLEVTSALDIAVGEQLRRVEAALRAVA